MALAPPAPPAETLPPGSTRRRVWHAPAVRSHSLVALTRTELYLAPAGPPPKPQAVAALQRGANLDAIFGPLAIAIGLASVSRVCLDLTANTVAIAYRPPRGDSGVGRADVTVACADHATADQLFMKLWRRLGPDVQLKRLGVPGGLARRPLSAIGGVLAATVAVSFASVVASDLSDPPALLAPFAALNWRVACGVGGAILAGLQLWLYRRLTRPPTALELTVRS